MSSNQARIVLPLKVDTGNNGNIMPLHICKKLFPSGTKEQLAAAKNENIKIKTYNSTTVTQLNRCKVKIENSNKIKICTSV